MENISQVFKATPQKLRAKLVYKSLADIQPELAGLFCGDGSDQQPVSFALLRKYLCSVCAFVAIEPMVSCTGLICS